MRAYFFVAILLQLVTLSSTAQSTDSLRRSIDSSAKKLKEATTEFNQWEDSVHRVHMQQFTDQNSKNLDQFLADMKAQKQKEKQQTYIRIGLGIAFLAVVGYGLYKRRKKNNPA